MIRIETINEAGKTLARTIENLHIPFDGEAIVFIGALGICVRKILPLVHDKHSDPAVICIDTTGRYVIPVLSGHVGGGNDLARLIANAIGAEAVVTTQSDRQGLWALDTLARRFGWRERPLANKDMNKAIATFVNRRATALVIEQNDEGTKWLETSRPDHVDIFHHYRDFVEARSACSHDEPVRSSYELVIIVSPRLYHPDDILCLQYCPPCLHLGVGCRRNCPTTAAVPLLDGIASHGFAPESIATIDSITLKKDEPLLSELSRRLPWAGIVIHTAESLRNIAVPNPSEKVLEVTGCQGVAEAAAFASGKESEWVVTKQKGWTDCHEATASFTWALVQDGAGRKDRGHVEIVGAGPGDPDLISVRGRRFLENADLILYAGSLVPKELTYCARPEALVRSSADMDLEEQFSLMKTFYDQGKLVVRLHTGDPCIYGAIQEQMAFFDRYGMDYHITPGISSFLAAAAELRSQFTIPERCQTIILTRGEGRTPMPDKEKLHLMAQHQSTMCIFLSAGIVDEVMNELLSGGYPPETPVAACYKLTWKEQRIYRGQLKDLARILKENHLTLTTMIVVGDAIDNRQGLSKLYDRHFTHLFRKEKP